MNFLRRLFPATRDPRDALRPLWARIVAIAREPEWYRDDGVADTLEGRFDMVTAVLAFVLLRMERDERLAVQTAPLTEIFVEEMDGQLRQSGVGDLMVGKQIGKLMATLGGRMGAFRTSLAAGGDTLHEVAARNITMSEIAQPSAIAERLRALAIRLEATDDRELLAGDFA